MLKKIIGNHVTGNIPWPMFTDSLGPVIQPEILPQNHTILRNQKPVK